MVLSDKEILEYIRKKDMISPFKQSQRKNKIISFGVSSYGYDFRIADEFKIFTNINNIIIDPKNFDNSSFVNFKGDVCIIPPNSFILGRSIEYFKIPKEILGICVGRSTYARCGLVLNTTPIEPEWEGHITIEISNTTPLPAKIYSNEGIGQLIFFRASQNCDISYKNKKGKYQGQTGITLPKI